MQQSDRQQNVVILGSTGSVGTSTLSVIAALPERFNVLGLSAANNQDGLQAQIRQFRPRYASLDSAADLTDVISISGSDALTRMATLDEADIVVVATTGHTAIEPTIAALQSGKIVALANKETIVAAGEIVMREAARSSGSLRTIDSEHSALWQCLGTDHFDPSTVKRLILTGSGGPFRGCTRKDLERVVPADALNHPTWSMGDKISIDSATLMNKGLEIIEASWLFNCPFDAIDVVIHPQSIVHSLVEFRDGALMAQLGSHDMRLPIQYALTYPDRVDGPAEQINLLELNNLTFEKPDLDVFPLLRLARQAAEAGSTYPTVLSVADSVAVEAFLAGKIGFLDIADVVDAVLSAHTSEAGPLTLEAVNAADAWAHSTACSIVSKQTAQ